MFNCGDRVAIMPREDAAPSEALEIGSVFFFGSIYIQLLDGRMFATIDGKSMGTRKVSYIVPATDEHFDALRSKGQQVAVDA